MNGPALRRELRSLSDARYILTQYLHELGYVNQLTEVRLQTLLRKLEEVEKAFGSSKEELAGLRKALDDQETLVRLEQAAHRDTSLSLRHEFKCERLLEKELAFNNGIVKMLVNFLNTMSMDGKLGISLPNDLNLGTLLFERETMTRDQENMKAVLDQLKRDLKDKDNVESLKREKAEDISQRLTIQALDEQGLSSAAEEEKETKTPKPVIRPIYIGNPKRRRT